MSAAESPPEGSAKRPGQSPGGARAEQERKERQARQLRANLAKRKQQQRKRDAGPEDGGGA